MRTHLSTYSLLTTLLALCPQFQGVTAFSSRSCPSTRSRGSPLLFGATTVEPPTRERTETDRRQKEKRSYDNDDLANMDDGREYPDLEYLIDFMESREMDDPFHILLMGSTFDKPKITVPYVTNSLEYVLSMPPTEGKELSQFAKEEGMSCLGTWPREECLSLGKQLQVRDIVCRVVPFCEGGQRGWQAKDANDASRSAGSSSGGASEGGFL